MKWPFGRRKGGAHRSQREPMIERGSGWRTLPDQQAANFGALLNAEIEALIIFGENQGDKRYRKPYLDAYRGLITYAEADQQILTIYAADQAKKKEAGES